MTEPRTCPICARARGVLLHSEGGRRRLRCPECGHRWTTHEIPEAELQRLRAIETRARELAQAVEAAS